MVQAHDIFKNSADIPSHLSLLAIIAQSLIYSMVQTFDPDYRTKVDKITFEFWNQLTLYH